MGFQQQTQKQKNVIRQDASKLMEDVLKLSKSIRDAGLDQAEEVGSQVLESIQDQVTKLEPHRKRLWDKTEALGRAADSSVKSQPYSYIGGALGIGFIIGKLISLNHNHQNRKQ